MILITNDLFDIAWRLTALNPNYKLYYNTQKRRYEVHNGKRETNTLEFVLPFDELDARAVEYARYSRVENAAAIFEEVERHNKQLDKHNLDAAVERAAAQIFNK